MCLNKSGALWDFEPLSSRDFTHCPRAAGSLASLNFERTRTQARRLLNVNFESEAGVFPP
jgi:hypothetical protein